MRLAYVGNFRPSFSSENHLAASFELLGHEVLRIQERDSVWDSEELLQGGSSCEAVFWTQTYDLDRNNEAKRAGIEILRELGIPVVGLHLDRWFDLAREDQLSVEPFFQSTTMVFTADGGNQERFEALGIPHRWMPPGIFEPEAVKGRPRREFTRDIAFVGNWNPTSYHAESKHRHELIRWLRRTYGRRVGFWPNGRMRSVRGRDLSDLYASVKIIVGDSCLVGTVFNARYCSDRIPETLGRGGFLLHPDVEGVTDGTLYVQGAHLACWTPFAWAELREKIEYFLRNDDERAKIAEAGWEHVRERHTYTRRMQEVLYTLEWEVFS